MSAVQPAYWGFWDLARIWLCFGLVIFRTFYTTVRFSVSLCMFELWRFSTVEALRGAFYFECSHFGLNMERCAVVQYDMTREMLLQDIA